LLVDRFRRETVIMSTQIVAHILYRRLVKSTPGVDVFGRIRHRGDVALGRDELTREVAEARDRLLELEARARVRLSPFVRSETASAIVDRALRAFSGYHSHPAAREIGAEVTAEDPTLLLYYQNRLVTFAADIAPESELAAAREIEKLGAVA
jgi:glycerol-3-phosphate O-acyltransferase